MRLGLAGSVRLSVLVVLSFVASDAPLLAQVAAAEVTGLVKDPAGGPVPGATVTVTDIATNLQRLVTSNSEGVYTAGGLAPGVYRIDVALSGFKPLRREGMGLAAGQKARIDFGSGRRRYSRTGHRQADAPMARAETASLGTLIAREQVVRLPLNGRAFITLAALAPGVALPPILSCRASTAAGRAPTSTSTTASPCCSPSPVRWLTPRRRRHQEFNVDSNSPPAEFGRFNGGVVNLTTKAGTNVLHGAASSSCETRRSTRGIS